MKQALRLLESLCNVEVIIISDANSVFIDIILSHHGLTETFKTVITNPAQFNEDGLLCVRYHDESGHECDRCPVNLCKGLALQQYLQKTREDGIPVCYDRIIYIGDGQGDVCPCLHLSDGDIAMARRRYPLFHMLNEEQGRSRLKAQLIPWDDGNDLLRFLQQTI
jgi:pyridoxal phosphate phosphatase PHOSPHO2